MKEVKLFSLLKGITFQEFSNLRNFITSPLFNNNKTLIILYEYLFKNYSSIAEGLISKQSIYNNVFDNQEFNKIKYWKLISSFAAIIDKYLIYNEFQKDVYYQKNCLLEAYRSRNMQKQFVTLSKEVQNNLGNEFNKGVNFFLNQTHYYFQNISYLGTKDIDKFEIQIKKMFESLRMFFVMTNFTSISIISNLNKNFINGSVSKLWLFDEIIKYLEQNKEYIRKNYTTVYVFFLIIQSKIHFNDDKYYFAIKRIVLSNKDKFSVNLLRHILINILDYAVNKLVKGEEKFLREIYTINKIMDEQALTLFGEYIPADYYYSVVEHSSMLRKSDWAREFIEKYKMYLSKDQRESSVNLSFSRISFENGDYYTSLQYSLKVENLNPYFYLSHKILLLQNYYSLKDFDAIPHVIETLDKYLKRRIDISGELKENYIKFLYYFRKLKAATNKNYLVDSLSKELRKEKFFLYKKWLLKKIKELGNKPVRAT